MTSSSDLEVHLKCYILGGEGVNNKLLVISDPNSLLIITQESCVCIFSKKLDLCIFKCLTYYKIWTVSNVNVIFLLIRYHTYIFLHCFVVIRLETGFCRKSYWGRKLVNSLEASGDCTAGDTAALNKGFKLVLYHSFIYFFKPALHFSWHLCRYQCITSNIRY